MKTFIIWKGEDPKDWEGMGDLPETRFECARLQKGDKLSMLVDTPNDGLVEYYAEVAEVAIQLDWDAKDGVDSEIDAVQWVYMKP